MSNKINKIQMPNGEVLELESGSGLEVCDIGMSLYVDETKGLRRYLNGQVVDRNANTQAFFTRLQEITTLHPSLLCAEDEWQAAKTMSAFGQVGKFVFNYSGDEVVSVRVPRVVNLQGVFDLQNLGLTVAAGLPNITAGVICRASTDSSSGGATSGTKTSDWGLSSGGNLNAWRTEFDASLSNTIYGKSNTVQEEAIQYPYFIQIATGSETENNIVNDIELNNPYSFGKSEYSKTPKDNLSWLASKGQWSPKGTYPSYYNWILENVNNGVEDFKLSTDTYDDYSWVINTADETFRLPLLNGSEDLPSGSYQTLNFVQTAIGTYTTTIAYNGTFVLRGTGGNGSVILLYTAPGIVADKCQTTANENFALQAPVKKGDTVSIVIQNTNITRVDQALLIKAVGNGSLYYYVGETVQNANLIDAGRIGEILPTKTDMAQAANASMPSNRYIDLTAASNVSYTAVADGWVCLNVGSSDNSAYVQLVADKFAVVWQAQVANRNGSLTLPVSKGQVFSMSLGGSVAKAQSFRFIYAQGTPSA